MGESLSAREATGLGVPRAPRSALLSGDSVRATLALVAGRAPALLLPTTVAAYLGATPETDRLFMALALATFVLNSVSATVESVTVPYLIAARRAGLDVGGFARRLMGWVALAGAAVVSLVAIAVWSAGDANPLDLHAFDVLAFVPLVVLGGSVSVLVGQRYSDSRYGMASSSFGLRTGAAIVAVATLSGVWGAWTVALGLTTGTALQLGLLLRRDRPRQPPLVAAATATRAPMRPFFTQAGWQLGGSLLLATIPLIDRATAWRLGVGSLSVLEYVERLWQLPVGLALSGGMIVCLTEWSRLHAGNRSLKRALLRDTRWVLVGSVPLVAIAVLAREPLMGWLLGWGSFPAARLADAAAVWAALMIGLPFYLVGLLYAKALIAARAVHWLFVVVVFQVATKLVLNGALAAGFGVAGIAAASAVAYALSGVLLPPALYWHLRRRADTP